MYEVEIIGDHSPYEQAGPLGKIRRVFPDINSMIRFGCRPSPRTFNIPHMGNKENAHVLGYMMCAKSVAERYSGTLSMIDDSAIKIGNPVRFFAYDEHPHKPLASQENGSSAPSAWGNMSNQHNYQSLQNAQNAVNGGIVSAFSSMGKDVVNIELPKLTVKTEEQSNKKDSSPEVMGDKAQVQSAEKTKDNVSANNGTEEKAAEAVSDSKEISGSDLNGTIGGIRTSSSYKGLRASYAAQKTDAQSIYYVSAIRRNINTNKESTMTLSLTFGRMMGEPSAIDQMLLLYKTYYDVNTGYCPQLADIVSESKKYRDTNNFKEYTVLAGDTVKSIAIKEYGIDISQPAMKAAQEKSDEEKRADKWTTLALKEANNANEPWDSETYNLKWNRRTGKSTGEFYKVQQTRLPNGQIQETPQKIGDFEIFIYDFDRTKFVYKGVTNINGEINNGEINKQDGRDYGTYVKNIADNLANSAGVKSSATNVTMTSDKAGTQIKWKSDLDLKTYETIEAFKDVLEQSNIQQQFDELKYAIIALNEGKFGNSLAQIEEQINIVLTNYIDAAIIIPKNLVLGEYKVPSKGETTDSKTTEGRQSQAQEPEIKRTKTETITGRDGEIKDVITEQEFDNNYRCINNSKGTITGISSEGNKKEIQRNNNNIQNKDDVNAERKRIEKNV